MHRQEGFRALYRGITPTLLGALPYEGIKFGAYDVLKRQSGEHGRTPLVRAICGATAGLLAHIVTYPNDTIRRRLQMQGRGGERERYAGYFDCLLQVVRQEGWGALYRGVGVTLLRTAPNTGIQFAVYEALKSWL